MHICSDARRPSRCDGSVNPRLGDTTKDAWKNVAGHRVKPPQPASDMHGWLCLEVERTVDEPSTGSQGHCEILCLKRLETLLA
jgi:hypothetical protein